MFKRLTAVLLIGLAVFIWGCSKDEDETTPTPTPTADNASGSVTSDTSGVIETPLGARIVVPEGAVPRTQSGAVGTMVFSIERDNDAAVTPPSGETLVTDVYRFGPEGFVLGSPVLIEIPVPGEGDPGEISIYRVNPTTHQAEYYGGEYDPGTRKIKAQTYEFSTWFGAERPTRSTAWGCLEVENNSNMWIRVCVDEYTLTYPETDGPSIPGLGMGWTWAPLGTIGWVSTGNQYMPQGTYRLCIQYTIGAEDFHYGHTFREDIVIDDPFNRTLSTPCQEMIVGQPASPFDGGCDCVPEPTTSVGTGDIQVTLTWHYPEPGVDLDLWVMDPDSEWCYYGNLQTASGGELDRDNWCSNYQDGWPENIFWTQTPPTGQYIVAVDWYSTCDTVAVGSLSFNVRTVVQGTAQTFTQTIQENEDMHEVTRFTISGSSVVYQPPRSDVSWVHLPRPSKL